MRHKKGAMGGGTMGKDDAAHGRQTPAGTVLRRGGGLGPDSQLSTGGTAKSRRKHLGSGHAKKRKRTPLALGKKGNEGAGRARSHVKNEKALKTEGSATH